MNGVRETQLKGRVSGVNAEVYVWLPPQYDQPAYRHHKFPVVELLPGYPGSAKAWFGSLHATAAAAAADAERPGRAVHPGRPAHQPAGRRGHGLRQHPGPVNADTWLSIDVPKMVMDNFRAEPAPAGWAVAGYSAGAHCAVKLAVAHPTATGPRSACPATTTRSANATRSPRRPRRSGPRNNPYLLLRTSRTPPRIALYVSGQPHDGYEAGVALEQSAKAPTTVHVIFIPKNAGGHNMALWRPQVVPAFRWLTRWRWASITRRTRSATPPVPSSAGSTHAALASGTASRAAAGRRR